jgi:hypothetical protein
MILVPTVLPVTRPVDEPIIALVLLLVHVPPVTTSAKRDVPPVHTAKVPVIGPGAEETVTVVVI